MKKILSVLLVITMLLTSVSTGLLGFAGYTPDKSKAIVTLRVSPDAKAYKWGDEIVFNVSASNNTEQDYENIKIRASANKTKFFYDGESNTIVIDELKAGETKDVQIKVASSKPNILQQMFILPIYYILDFLAPLTFKASNFDATTLVKVGAFRYKFGFDVTDGKVAEDTSDSPTTSDKYRVSIDLNYRGAEKIQDQWVSAGETATEPEIPDREGYMPFLWFSSIEKKTYFDFSAPITEDVNVTLTWIDSDNTHDSDNDGILDEVENLFGSDPTKVDTDNDGVSDFNELDWLNSDPTTNDTNNDGKPDGMDDADADGLTNAEEDRLGTNPSYYDTDHDYVTDYDEVTIYHTDPLNVDTDGDAVTDGTEIINGSNPLVAEVSFTTSASLGIVDENNPVSVEASVKTDAEGAGTLKIQEVSSSDNVLISKMIPGYLGSAFDFTTDGEFEEATLTFYYDTALGTIGDDFQPCVYYVNETTGEFEELPNQIVEDGKVTVKVEHFSTYILLNKVAFDIIWNAEIKAPITNSQGNNSGIDVIFVIDVSGSMSGSRLNTAKAALNTFLDALGQGDRAALVKFESSATILSTLTDDIDSVKSKVSSLYASGGTAMYRGLDQAIDQLSDPNENYGYKMIIMLSDGEDSPSTSYSGYYQSRVDNAVANNITIYTIGAGTSSTSILTQVANNTGGSYYAATATSGITDAFDLIKQDTVDVTADSNNDDLSDYYTDLLNKGALKLSNGTVDLTGITDYYGEDDTDWDNDGLLNGEEIIIVESHGKVYAQMISNPILTDTDGDGFSDFEEVKKYSSNPLKYSKNGGKSFETLVTGYYKYEEATREWSEGLQYFDWHKTSESKETYINYFYNYASEQTINQNADKVESLSKREKAWEIISGITKIVGIGKDLLDSGTDLASNKEAVEKTVKKYNDDHKAKVKMFNEGKYDKIVKDWCDDYKKGGFKNAVDIFESAVSMIDDFDFSGILEGIDSVEGVVGFISTVTSTITAVNEKFSLNLGKTFNDFSTKYQTWMGQTNGAISNANVVGFAFDVVDLASDIGDLTVLYGKLQANSEAFIEYIDLIDYISQNGSHDYIRNAAGDIAKIVLDTSNTEYYKQLAGAIGAKTAVVFVKTAVSIVGNVCPYVKAAEMIYKTAKLLISLTGLPVHAKAMVKAQGIKAISDGCIQFLNGKYEIHGTLYSFDKENIETVELYLTQLAQSRIVGEEAIFSYWDNIGILQMSYYGWVALFTGTAKPFEEMNACKNSIQETYKRANVLGLNYSKNLPYYSDYYTA